MTSAEVGEDPDESRFYAERDRRTVEVGGDTMKLSLPIAVHIGAGTAATELGQITLMAAVDMLARVHRHLVLHVPDVPTADGTPLAQAAAALAKAINPYIHLAPHIEDHSSLGVGDDTPACSWHVGSDGWIGETGHAPMPITDGPNPLGAILAACLGAAAMFWRVHDVDLDPIRLSLWDLEEGEGPVWSGPLDVGDVAVVGAGAVGTGLGRWLGMVGVRGRWRFVDRDVVKLHNTNRTVGFSAAHAGWPDGLAAMKAEVAASLCGAEATVGWYHEWLAEDPERPALILSLANGADVRHLIGARSEPVLLHASTSRDGTAELHRHLPNVDDCIACRFPDHGEPIFECSTIPIPASGDENSQDGAESGDAALPFLSAIAALLLLAALAQLPDGALVTGRHNHWRLFLCPTYRKVQCTRHRCAAGCASILPPATRALLNKGRRWAQIDQVALRTIDPPDRRPAAGGRDE